MSSSRKRSATPDDVVLVVVEELPFPVLVTIRPGKKCVPAVPVICSRIDVNPIRAIDDGAGKKRGQCRCFLVKKHQFLREGSGRSGVSQIVILVLPVMFIITSTLTYPMGHSLSIGGFCPRIFFSQRQVQEHLLRHVFCAREAASLLGFPAVSR